MTKIDIFDEVFQADITEAFVSQAPTSYDYWQDADTPYPWCTPWAWMDAEDFAALCDACGYDPQAIAADILRRHGAEIAEFFTISNDLDL